MNDLSWMLYWADVAPKLASALCVFMVLVFLVSLIVCGLGFTGFYGA